MKKIKKIKEKLSNGFLNLYLFIFLVYIAINIFAGVYSYIYIKNFGYNEFIFGYIGEMLIGLIFFMFNIFNIYVFVRFLRQKVKSVLIFLSFSEILNVLWFLFLSSIISTLFIVPLNLQDNIQDILSYLLKLIQLSVIIYLLAKNKKQNVEQI